MVKMHLGSGNVILPGFINLDIRREANPDIIADVKKLPFNDNSFNLVYSSHILEHFPRNETEELIREWVRVIKEGGELRLSVPSIEQLILIYKESKKLETIIGPLYGGQDHSFNFHHTIFDEPALKGLMLKCGLVAIHRWDFKRTSHGDIWDYSQAETYDIPISLNIAGRKK